MCIDDITLFRELNIHFWCLKVQTGLFNHLKIRRNIRNPTEFMATNMLRTSVILQSYEMCLF